MGGRSSKSANAQFDEFEKTLPSMDGTVVVITGCTTGTGFVAARTVAKLGGQVVMLNRASPRVDAAVASLKEACPENAVFHVVPCDLQDFESVKTAAAEINSKFGQQGVNVLCNNAGVMAMPDVRTKDGYDVQMQTNHLSHFLLTKELMPLLEKAVERTGEARVVNHSSIAAYQFQGTENAGVQAKYYEKCEPGTLGGDSAGWFFTGARWVRYTQTKLANVIFTLALAQKLKAKGSKVKALVAHPGLSATNLQTTTHDAGSGMGPLLNPTILRWMSQSAEDGTIGILTCICQKDVASGDFYGPANSSTPSMKGPVVKIPLIDYLKTPAFQTTLWEESAKAVGDFTI